MHEETRSSLILHFSRTKNDVVREIGEELHRDYLLAIGTWMKDPTTTIVGNSLLARLFGKMGCTIEEYDTDGYYIITLPHGELM